MRMLLLVTLATVALAGCGKDEKPPEDRSAAASAVQPTSPASSAAPPPAMAEERPAAPASAPKSTATAAAGATYTVVKGDTLSGIAKKHGVSAADLARWNEVSDPRRLRVGQQLRLTAP